MPYDALTATGFQYGRPRFGVRGRNDGNGGPGYFGNVFPVHWRQFLYDPEMSSLFTLANDARNENILGGQIICLMLPLMQRLPRLIIIWVHRWSCRRISNLMHLCGRQISS